MRKFLFARIHFIGLFGQSGKDNLLSDLQEISDGAGFVRAAKYDWTFREVKTEHIDNKDYISGKIIKINPVKEEIIVDETTKGETADARINVKEKESLFIIDIHDNFIAFEVFKKLTKKQVVQFFVAAYRHAAKDYDPELDFTFDEQALLDELSRMKRASGAHFCLKATNPDPYDEFREIDEAFQRSGVAKGDLNLKPHKGKGLVINDPQSLVRQALAMSAAGYGSGEIYGEDLEGNPFSIKTGDSQIDSIEVQDTKNEEEVKRTIIIKFEKKKPQNRTSDE